MAKLYLTWTRTAAEKAIWLSQLITACTGELPLTSKQGTTPLSGGKPEGAKIECFFGVLAAEKSSDSPYPSSQPSKEFMAELRSALDQNLAAYVLVDENIEIPSDLNEKCRWRRTAFSEPSALLALIPTIVSDIIATFRSREAKALMDAITPTAQAGPVTFIYDSGELKDKAGHTITTYIYDQAGTLINTIKPDMQNRDSA